MSKVYIRPITYDDTELVVKWRAMKFVQDNFIFREPITREVHENWMRTKVDTGEVVQFIICVGEEGFPIGSVYLNKIDRKHSHCEYGIFIGEEDFLGKGYGTEAARLAINYAFDELKLHKIVLRLLGDNMRARKSYEKAGFVYEGTSRDYVLLDGKYRDVVFMGIINPKSK